MKTIYYFTAEWCQPCKKTKPIVEDLNREQNEAHFQIIDVDDNKHLAELFDIRSIPTFILMKDGVSVKREIGAQTRQQLIDLIKYEEDN